MRAWIEIEMAMSRGHWENVALYMRAWIEITYFLLRIFLSGVALYMRAWIEMQYEFEAEGKPQGRPLHEGVD